MKGVFLKEAIQQTIIASQFSDLRPELNSILFDFSLEVLKLVSTDGFRLAEKTIAANLFTAKFPDPFHLLVPLRTAQELLRIVVPPPAPSAAPEAAPAATGAPASGQAGRGGETRWLGPAAAAVCRAALRTRSTCGRSRHALSDRLGVQAARPADGDRARVRGVAAGEGSSTGSAAGSTSGDADRTPDLHGAGRRCHPARGTEDDAAPVAVLKVGVIGRIRSCEAGSAWCRVQAGEYRGFLKRSQFSGVLPDEVIAPIGPGSPRG